MEYDGQSVGNPEWGYAFDFSPAASEVVHDFCGSHEIVGGECPHCRKPLLRLLTLHATDPQLQLDSTRHPRVHLLYCWTCSIPFGEFSYKINADGSVELLKVPGRQPENEHGEAGPYDGYTGRFPHRAVALRPISEDAQRRLSAHRNDESVYLESEDDLFEPRHQVGGFPFVCNPAKTFCPVCSREMPVLAAICDDAAGDRSFDEQKSFAGSGGGVQMMFQFCRQCSIVSAYHSMD